MFSKDVFPRVIEIQFCVIKGKCIIPFPHDKILGQTKLKAFADNKLNVTIMIISVFDRVENIVGKGEIARCEQFLLFPKCFQKACVLEASKVVIVREWVKPS